MSQAAFHLRPARPADAPVIRSLVKRANLNPTGLDWPRFIVAVNPQDEVIGCIQRKPHRDGSLELASLVVAPEWRGRQVARALVEALLQANPGEMHLMCRASLGRFYEQFGFRALGRAEMPPYFRRIHNLFRLLRFLRPAKDGLLVMKRGAAPQARR
jgi:N-acetylglutamate synthase-like GNAT family acetyltransferase